MISLQLIDLLQPSITPCISCLHSPNTTLFASGLLTKPLDSALQFVSLVGYSVCTNRCNIRCGPGSFLSMVTSHLLAVPIPNQLIVTTCGLHVYDTFNHSLVTPSVLISDFVSTFDCCLRLRFFGFATSNFPTLVLPCACSIFPSGGLPRIWKLSLPYSLELA